jgi:fructose-bisphosphate aldolase, class I
MNSTLTQTLAELCVPGKGILAADESVATIGKRFDSIKLDNTASTRQDYRAMLATTATLGQYISGIILFEETLTQVGPDKRNLVDVLREQKIVPGIKVDKGLIAAANSSQESLTQGLDGLAERLEQYQQQGARFAKWRCVYTITEKTPSTSVLTANAECLARYAAICQALSIVPIVEPEVLMDGDHDLLRCAEVSEQVLHEVFNALYTHNVKPELMILKPNMVLPAKHCAQQSTPEQIAALTLQTLKRTVPSAVPSINFLSGGQSPPEATVNLQALNSLGNAPWQLSFSYGRALQAPCLKAWQGKRENVTLAQDTLIHRARLNALASRGDYTSALETA